jgi:hypothetical protein
MTNNWGKPTWFFFHSLAEQVNDEFYKKNYKTIFNFIVRICTCLPCPDCTKHATLYLNKIHPSSVNTKEKLQNMLFSFHNTVNIRKRKPIFNNFNIYKFSRLDLIFNEFKNQYINNKVSNRGFNDILYRKNIIIEIEKFIDNNKFNFKWFK